MLGFILKRILIAVPTLLVTIIITFTVMHVAPGGPFDTETPLSPAVRAALQSKYGLDQPLHLQLWRYLIGLPTGDFGPSYLRPAWSVSEILMTGLPISVQLASWALAVACLVGIPVGCIAGARQNSMVDHAVMSTAAIGMVLPRLVFAPVLSLVLAVILRLLPVGGWNAGAWQNKILPVTALALPVIAYLARISRGAMIEALASDYITTAHAKGLPERIVLFRHAIRPVLVPVLTYLGPGAAGLMAGSVVIEKVFGLPGLGLTLVTAAVNRDYLVVMGAVILFATILMAMNLLAELAHGWLDPRIRTGLR